MEDNSGRWIHFYVGMSITALYMIVGLLFSVSIFSAMLALCNFIACLGVALAHEQAPRDDGATWYDFIAHWWNGGFDVLSFMPASTLWLLVALWL